SRTSPAGSARLSPRPGPCDAPSVLDLHLTRLARGRLAQVNRQHAVTQRGVHAVRVDVARERHPEFELTDPPGLPAQESGALLLLDLALDPYLAVAQFDVHVLPFEAR